MVSPRAIFKILIPGTHHPRDFDLMVWGTTWVSSVLKTPQVILVHSQSREPTTDRVENAILNLDVLTEIEKEGWVKKALLKKPPITQQQEDWESSCSSCFCCCLVCFFLIRLPLISLVLLRECSWGDRNLRLPLHTWNGRTVEEVSRSIPGQGNGLNKVSKVGTSFAGTGVKLVVDTESKI